MSETSTNPKDANSNIDFDIVVVGAGFAGLYRLRQYACLSSKDILQEWHRTEEYAS